MANTKKKICYIVDTLNSNSGWGRLAYEIIEGVRRSGKYDVVVLSREKSGYPDEHVLIQHGLKGIIRSSLSARKFVKEADLVHAVDGWPYAVIAWLANFLYARPLFITAVGTYSVLPLKRFFQGIILKHVYRRARRILAISNYTRNKILENIKLTNIDTVNPGVDYEKFHRACSGLSDKQNMILSVGAVKERKGYHAALEAFFKLRKNFYGLKYIIAGSYESNSNYFKYLEEIIGKNNGGGSVIFAGNISEKKLLELYCQAKIFLMPSINAGGAFEGFGLVVLEANSAGVPAVGTTPSGIDDIIMNGVNGYLVSQNDDAGVASAIEKILTDSELYLKLSAGSIRRAQEMPWEKTIESYLRNYEQ